MITITREDHDDPPIERCCFCRAVTGYWTALADRRPCDQVACCVQCSRYATPADVPTKWAWCQRERIASPDMRASLSAPPPSIVWPTGRPTPRALGEEGRRIADRRPSFTGTTSVQDQLYSRALAALGARPAPDPAVADVEKTTVHAGFIVGW